MTEVIGDSEEQRVIDWIQANTNREAMEESATFINRKWIAQSYIGVKDGLLTIGENVTNIVLWDLVVEHKKNYLKKEKTLWWKTVEKENEAVDELQKRSSRRTEKSLSDQQYNDIVLNKG